MRSIRRLFLVTPAALALAACSGDAPPHADAGALGTPDLLGADLTPAFDLARGADVALALDLGHALDTTPGRDVVPDQRAARDDAAMADGAPVDGGCAGWTSLLHLSPAEAKALTETADVIVINVHTPYEGDIPGTDATIPFDDVDAIEAYLGHDPCADLLLVCKSGAMSTSAGNELVRRGYRRVRDLKGGLLAWSAAGYPVLKDGGI